MVADPRLQKANRWKPTAEEVIDLGGPRPSPHGRYSAPRSARRPRCKLPDPQLFENVFNSYPVPAPAQRTRRRRRASPLYTPNPRLYPGVQPKSQKSAEVKKRAGQRPPATPSGARGKRGKRTSRSLVPNPRLYQAPPARARAPPPPPPLRPRTSWSPPPAKAPQQTASQIALRFAERQFIPFREVPKLVPPTRKTPKAKFGRAKTAHGRTTTSVKRDSQPEKHKHKPRLAANPQSPTRPYEPRSQHFRVRSLDVDSVSARSSRSLALPARRDTPPTLAADPGMALTPQPTGTPEDGSDANDSLSSAPSEYLAEFLSAIMGRKYAEALKYCRLILQYEPHNATARGFYPLLQHKVGQSQRPSTARAPTHEKKPVGSSSSEESGSSAGPAGATRSTASAEGVDDAGAADGSDDESADSCAELSLDSSAQSSRSASPAAHGKSSASDESAECAEVVSAHQACWFADDNGNPRPRTRKNNRHDHDVENDNAASDDHTMLLNDPMLRELRAQFACSTK